MQIILIPCRFLQHFKMSVTPRVLSIQSHVVSGYVGNKSAVFPMQVFIFNSYATVLILF